MNLLDVNYWEARYLLALLNFGMCSLIGFICLCRISVTSLDTTKRVTRAAYAVLMCAATCSGISPVFNQWPSWPEIGMSGAVLLLLWSGVAAWKHGVPNFAKSGTTPFDESPRELKS